jgi:hypothetical protein
VLAPVCACAGATISPAAALSTTTYGVFRHSRATALGGKALLSSAYGVS